MSQAVFLKSALAWLFIALLAIGNGLFREAILTPRLGENIALPTSGIILSLLVGIVSFFYIPLLGKNRRLVYFYIGLQWILMTLAFEFLFGHYVMGKSWAEIAQVFNLFTGDLFNLVLLVTLFSPYAVAKRKGLMV